jgi:NAD dependent epimerase/dehydratase family enzyme
LKVVIADGSGQVGTVMLGLVRRGLGGTNGDGKQYVSWIHYQDFIRAIYWLIDHEQFDGPVNIASPNPLPNAKFMRTLCKSWGAIIGVPTPTWMLEIGAHLMQTETELILKSRRVAPGRLLESGFVFEYPEWDAACADLCGKWRGANR